ncbi:hypothetical protein [Enterobacter phage 03_vB_Eclo_IJM]|nr:hypothetical protein [Enterobacter phage 03_vB_Eclo_IJM]
MSPSERCSISQLARLWTKELTALHGSASVELLRLK